MLSNLDCGDAGSCMAAAPSSCVIIDELSPIAAIEALLKACGRVDGLAGAVSYVAYFIIFLLCLVCSCWSLFCF